MHENNVIALFPQLAPEPLLTFERTPIDGDVLICPYFRCATCGEKIADGHAVVAFETDADYRYTGNITARHQGTCDRLAGRPTPWRHVGELLMQLCRNSEVDPALLREVADAIEKGDA